MDAAQDGLVRLRMELVAQKPDHSAPEPHPVGQHGLGQQSSDFFHAVVWHAGAPIIAEVCAREIL
jgi:hypothetical protein